MRHLLKTHLTEKVSVKKMPTDYTNFVIYYHVTKLKDSNELT